MSEQTYRTRDLALGGFLLTMGYPLIDADKSEAGKVVFIFGPAAGKPTFVAAVTAYKAGHTIVEPSRFYLNTKHLKTIIYGGFDARKTPRTGDAGTK